MSKLVNAMDNRIAFIAVAHLCIAAVVYIVIA